MQLNSKNGMEHHLRLINVEIDILIILHDPDLEETTTVGLHLEIDSLIHPVDTIHPKSPQSPLNNRK